MSKRIFTVILALVLSLTALSFGAEAEWSGAKLEYDESGKTLKLSWVEFSADAAKYTATIYNSSNASVRTQTFTKDANGNVTKELSYSNPAGGKYYAEVVAYNSDGRKLDSCITSDVTVPTVVTNNGITLTQAANGSVTVSWNTVTGAVAYIVDVNYRDANNKAQTGTHNVGSATTYTVNDADYDKLTSITVSYQDSALNKRTIGTVYPSSSGGGSLLPGYTGGDGVGQVTLNYYTGVLSWINQGSQPHYVTAYLIGQSLGKNNCLMQGSCDVSSLLRQYYNQVIYFTVYAGDPDNGGVAIGSATYNPNYTGIYPGTGSGNTGINVVVSGGWATVTWNQVPYATAYNVQYVINGRTYNRQLSSTQTSVQLDCSSGLQVVVSYVYNGGTYTVGSATVSADGVVTYGGTTGINVTGNNCTLNVGATTSTVTWYPNSAAMGYNVIYTNNDNGSTQVATLSSTTTATIPLGYNNCNSFDVNVIALSTTGNGIIASVRYSGNIYLSGGIPISDTDKISLTFDIPVYGFYGYLTAGDYMKLDLPTYFGDYVPAGLGINWYLQIDGSKYTLQKSTTTSGGAAISANANRVYLGVIGHDFDGQDTTIPQSIAYNQYSSFRLVAELDSFSYPKNPDGSYKTANEIINVGSLFNGNNPVYGRPASLVKADWFKSDDTPVPGSTSYVFSWPTTVAVIGSSSGQTPTPTPTPTVCEHTFEYQSCTEVHWKHCTKCGYTCEVGEHSAANGSCSVCGRSSTSSRFDVNGNGHVDLQDAVMILRRLAHLD